MSILSDAPQKIIDSLGSFGTVMNSWLSNSIVHGIAEATGVDDMIMGSAYQPALMSTVRTGGYVTLVGEGSRALRSIFPMLKVFSP